MAVEARHSKILRVPQAERGCCEFAEDEEGTLLSEMRVESSAWLMGSLSLMLRRVLQDRSGPVPILARPGWGAVDRKH